MRRALVAVAALVLAGCGATEAGLSPAAERALAGPVQELRYTATARNLPEAKARIAAIRDKVDELERSGDLTEERATRVRRAVDDVERELASLPAATASTNAPPVTAGPGTTEPPPTAAPPTTGDGGEGGDDGKGDDGKGDDGKGDDKGKGDKDD